MSFSIAILDQLLPEISLIQRLDVIYLLISGCRFVAVYWCMKELRHKCKGRQVTCYAAHVNTARNLCTYMSTIGLIAAV